MKIINRKVHDLQIKHRKIERKENKRKMKEQKRIEESKINYKIVDEQYKYCDKLLQKAYNKYGKFVKQVEYFIGIEEKPHIVILVSMFDIPFKEIFY